MSKARHLSRLRVPKEKAQGGLASKVVDNSKDGPQRKEGYTAVRRDEDEEAGRMRHMDEDDEDFRPMAPGPNWYPSRKRVCCDLRPEGSSSRWKETVCE